MAINVSGELFAATSKGKLGSASQIFLSGDTENVEEKLAGLETSSSENEEKITELTEQSALVNSLIEELQAKIQQLDNSIKQVEENALKIEVLTPTEWEALKASGQVQSGVLYGILETESEQEEGEVVISQIIEVDAESGKLSITDATYDYEEETLSLFGSYDPVTEKLTLDSSIRTVVPGSGTTTSQEAELSSDGESLVTKNMELVGEDKITIVGELDTTGEVLTITI